VTQLSSEIASDIISGLASRVAQTRSDARQGRYGFGGHDIPQALALLNAWHPDVANWDPLFELLDDDVVSPADKRGALETLASLADRLTDDVRGRLKSIAVKVAERPSAVPPSPFGFGSPRDAMGAGALLEAALGALDATDAASRLVHLLSGGVDERRWAAQVAYSLARPEDIGTLAALAQDSDVSVRATAARALGFLVARGQGGALVITAAEQCAAEPGTLVPGSLAAALAAVASRDAQAERILERLQAGHPSARVRLLAGGAPAQ
jgi:HEAT repeat protein